MTSEAVVAFITFVLVAAVMLLVAGVSGVFKRGRS